MLLTMYLLAKEQIYGDSDNVSLTLSLSEWRKYHSIYALYAIISAASGYTADGYLLSKNDALSHLNSMKDIEEALVYGNGIFSISKAGNLFSESQKSLMDADSCLFWTESECSTFLDGQLLNGLHSNVLNFIKIGNEIVAELPNTSFSQSDLMAWFSTDKVSNFVKYLTNYLVPLMDQSTELYELEIER
eukprot:Nk52_evm18s2039 gene=Nk52_evmTU18s2039